MGHFSSGLRAFIPVSLFVVTVAVQAPDARAQAWVPDKGQLGVDFDYNFSTSSKVVTDTTEEFTEAGSTSHQLTIGAEYVPIQKLAISASLPVLSVKYTGQVTGGMPITGYQHPGGGTYDDGAYHTTLTDLRAGARYQVLDEPVAVGVHLAASIPVADYETIGNAVAGRHLKMLHAGAGVGYLIGLATYAHLLYEFTLAEKYDRVADTAQYGQNRSDLGLTIGTKLLDYRLDLHAGANARFTHGGVNFSDFMNLSADAQLYHDAILNEDVFLVGAGVGYDISNSLTATLDARIFVAALSQNTLNASVVALGLAWSPL